MATYNVTLSAKDSKYIEAVRQLCEREIWTNPNLSGATIDVSVDDFTAVNGGDELVGTVLLATIGNVLSSDDEETP